MMAECGVIQLVEIMQEIANIFMNMLGMVQVRKDVCITVVGVCRVLALGYVGKNIYI